MFPLLAAGLPASMLSPLPNDSVLELATHCAAASQSWGIPATLDWMTAQLCSASGIFDPAASQ